MANYWNIPGIPHKGWQLVNVIDIREDGQSVDDSEYATCQMCNNERIRYVHIVSHPDVETDLKVGCVCASKMTDDYVTPARKENELKNKSSRRINWMQKTWNESRSGNYYLKKDDHFLLIFKDKSTNKYKCKIDKTYGLYVYDTFNEAKSALFKGMEWMKDRGEW